MVAIGKLRKRTWIKDCHPPNYFVGHHKFIKVRKSCLILAEVLAQMLQMPCELPSNELGSCCPWGGGNHPTTTPHCWSVTPLISKSSIWMCFLSCLQQSMHCRQRCHYCWVVKDWMHVLMIDLSSTSVEPPFFFASQPASHLHSGKLVRRKNRILKCAIYRSWLSTFKYSCT